VSVVEAETVKRRIPEPEREAWIAAFGLAQPEPQIGRVQRDGFVIVTVPECWVLFNPDGRADGWMRGDTHLDVFTPDAAHMLFSKGKALRHERITGWTVRGMSNDEGLALTRAAQAASVVL